MGVLRSLVLVGLFGLLAAGCARKDTAQTHESTSSQPAAPSPATESTTPAGGNSAQILTELRQHETELAQIVEQGRLGEVHGKVEAINTLLAAAPDRATDLPEASRTQLRERAASAAKMADALHDAGDAGDLSATKMHLGHFQADLTEIENILAGRP
jgi:hypothetical protein